jgi:hypothetical protein
MPSDNLSVRNASHWRWAYQTSRRARCRWAGEARQTASGLPSEAAAAAAVRAQGWQPTPSFLPEIDPSSVSALLCLTAPTRTSYVHVYRELPPAPARLQLESFAARTRPSSGNHARSAVPCRAGVKLASGSGFWMSRQPCVHAHYAPFDLPAPSPGKEHLHRRLLHRSRPASALVPSILEGRAVHTDASNMVSLKNYNSF